MSQSFFSHKYILLQLLEIAERKKKKKKGRKGRREEEKRVMLLVFQDTRVFLSRSDRYQVANQLHSLLP